MAWFSLKSTNQSRLKGIWLRVRNLSSDVLDAIEATHMQRKNEYIERVVIVEFNKKSQIATLEVWSRENFNNRWTVFYVVLPVNPEWICESDLGRGFSMPREG